MYLRETHCATYLHEPRCEARSRHIRCAYRSHLTWESFETVFQNVLHSVIFFPMPRTIITWSYSSKKYLQHGSHFVFYLYKYNNRRPVIIPRLYYLEFSWNGFMTPWNTAEDISQLLHVMSLKLVYS